MGLYFSSYINSSHSCFYIFNSLGLILTSKAFGDEELMEKIASNDNTAIMSVLEPNQNLFLMLLPFVGMILAVFFHKIYT